MWRWNADFTGWESVNEEITDWQGGYNDEFKFKKGQLIRDINPDCPHHGSEGEVTKVTKDEVTYTVRNNGKTYKVGDELTKTKDQLIPLSIEEFINESMSKSQIKKMRDEFEETGELPPHLKKMLKDKKEFEKKFKVKNIVVPGLEWMSDINEKISKEEWAQYPKYARKLKPYMQRLLKVPLRAKVIKQANANPWIDISVVRFGKDIIPNDFRKKALKVIGGRANDMDNIRYGNIKTTGYKFRYYINLTKGQGRSFSPVGCCISFSIIFCSRTCNNFNTFYFICRNHLQCCCNIG